MIELLDILRIVAEALIEMNAAIALPEVPLCRHPSTDADKLIRVDSGTPMEAQLRHSQEMMIRVKIFSTNNFWRMPSAVASASANYNDAVIQRDHHVERLTVNPESGLTAIEYLNSLECVYRQDVTTHIVTIDSLTN